MNNPSTSRVMDAISELKNRGESIEESVKDKTGVDLVGIVEKLSRRAAKK